MEKISEPLEMGLGKLIQTVQERNAREFSMIFPYDYPMRNFLNLAEVKAV